MQSNRKEIWKDYPLNLKFKTGFRIEFSNLGRIRTFSRLAPNGTIINGSLQSGFPIFRTTYTGELKPKDAEKLQLLDNEIAELHQEIKNFGLKSAFQNKAENLGEKLDELKKKRAELVKKRSQLNKKFRKKDSVYIAILVHKAVAELFLEKPLDESKKFVIHLDFDKLNNKVENLAYANQEELTERQMKHPKVILHEFKKQFEDKIPNVRRTKLSENDVLFIKSKLESGRMSIKKLAQKFGVSDMQIHRIKTGENWGHVKTVSELKAELAEIRK